MNIHKVKQHHKIDTTKNESISYDEMIQRNILISDVTLRVGKKTHLKYFITEIHFSEPVVGKSVLYLCK